jgi:hypothetical protein
MSVNEPRQNYTVEMIKKAAEEIEKGDSVVNACLKYNLPRGMVSRWV